MGLFCSEISGSVERHWPTLIQFTLRLFYFLLILNNWMNIYCFACVSCIYVKLQSPTCSTGLSHYLLFWCREQLNIINWMIIACLQNLLRMHMLLQGVACYFLHHWSDAVWREPFFPLYLLLHWSGEGSKCVRVSMPQLVNNYLTESKGIEFHFGFVALFKSKKH